MSVRPFTILTASLVSVAVIALTSATPISALTPPLSTFFATAAEESYSTYHLSSDGDLWPSCWADDGNLYAANGDGTAFDPFNGYGSRYDLAVSRISGMPPSLTGTTLNTNVGTNWSGNGYNRKPTGMVCVNNAIYLAFQNLDDVNFNDAPAASIAKSTDHGAHWTWDSNAPMFSNHVFTTIFFLDYGQNNANAIDGYVYAYGLDNNWRAQQDVYLARVPNTSIQDRSTWQFYTGTDGGGNPTWTSNIGDKMPVLEDDRMLYPSEIGTPPCPASEPVIGQGGVTYDAPLHRYIFVSWTCPTHEFYEAPQPWGPWSLFLSKDFGAFVGAHNQGMYGTSIPSKFISSDGKTLDVQSNVCCGPGDSYTFSLRQLFLQPYASTTPGNAHSDTNNLAMTGSATTAISKSTHFGTLCGPDCSDSINDGLTSGSEDDYDAEAKTTDWWGYTWNQTYNMNRVVYTTGAMFPDGGWFSGNLRVQVRQNFNWVDVSNLSVSPAYPYSAGAGSNTTYTFTFDDTWGDGVRIIGTPGGSSHFTSISELAVQDAGLPTFGPSPGDQSVPYDDHLGFTISASDPDGDALSFSQTGLPSGLTLTDNHNGTATISGYVQAVPNTYPVTFTVDDGHDNTAKLSLNIVVTKEDTTLTYTGDTVIAQGGAATLSARLLEDGNASAPIAGRTIDLALGSQHCSPMPVTNAGGVASCTLTNITLPQGPEPITATFAGDAYYLGSSDSKTAIVFAFLERGAFALGDATVAAATSSTTVTWWAAHWSSSNALSGGQAPHAFKGFASTTSSNPPACGGTWTGSPGDSSGPPGAASIPSYMGVVVPTGVTKHGSTIAGNIAQIVVVKTSAGYDADPGHPGTGTIVATFCH
jgi:hypothetical protein